MKQRSKIINKTKIESKEILYCPYCGSIIGKCKGCGREFILGDECSCTFGDPNIIPDNIWEVYHYCKYCFEENNKMEKE